MNLVKWFKAAWRDDGDKQAVIAGYQELRQHPLVLADIARRGGLFSTVPQTGSETAIALAIAEGRRQMALETLRLANVDPAQFLPLIFRTSSQKDTSDA